ncbi:MAG TPA: IPTL-CTERM sorting domain-containing protein, partial [Thermoanaerobaculia bacterium]|nr:IPTL-CTERM sorting domain-containing protein [Thermoanaerobaculia bacterium]
GEGGLRVASGCNGAGWDGFDGNFDAVAIGVNDKTSTYDFEAALPVITIDDLAQAEGTGGTTQLDFTLHLDTPTSDIVSVDYTLVPDSATSPGDFAPGSGTVFFGPQALTTTISVQVVADAAQEPDETFFVDLSNPQFATLGDDQAIGTIVNDDQGAVDADLSIVKLGPATANGGDPVNYTINVTNNGPADASDVVVNDTIPAGTTFVSATPSQGTCNAASPVVCNLGQVLATSGASIALVVNAPNATGQITNTASVTNSPETDPQPNNNSSSVPTNVSNDADLSIVKTGPSAADAGDPINYTITVTNNGPVDASNVVVNDTIPPGTTFVSATPSQGTCNAASPLVCNLGQILAGNGASIALVVNAPNANGQITNTASVTNSPQTDPTPTNNSSSVPTTVSGAPAPVEIPTASAWGLLVLAAALAAFGLRRLR